MCSCCLQVLVYVMERTVMRHTKRRGESGQPSRIPELCCIPWWSSVLSGHLLVCHQVFAILLEVCAHGVQVVFPEGCGEESSVVLRAFRRVYSELVTPPNEVWPNVWFISPLIYSVDVR